MARSGFEVDPPILFVKCFYKFRQLRQTVRAISAGVTLPAFCDRLQLFAFTDISAAETPSCIADSGVHRGGCDSSHALFDLLVVHGPRVQGSSILVKGLFRLEASIKSSTCCLPVRKRVSFHKYPR